MQHVRTLIRQRFREALVSRLPEETHRIFSGRISMVNHDETRTLVDIIFDEDNTLPREVMGPERVHVATFLIRIQLSAPDEQIDEAMDYQETLVVSAIECADFSDMLEEHPELTQASFFSDASSSLTMGLLVLRYNVEYRIDKREPTRFIA